MKERPPDPPEIAAAKKRLGINGKGSKRRPSDIDTDEFARRWDLVFGKKGKRNDRRLLG